MTAPLAHAGHWLVDLLYIAPIVVVLGVLAYRSFQDRRELRREGGPVRRPPSEPGMRDPGERP